MKLANYEFEGPFTDPYDVKELPGVYVVLSGDNVLDVGEAGWRYREGGEGLSKRLRRHPRRQCWKEHQGAGVLLFVVHYEPEGDKRLEIEDAVRREYKPPCGTTPAVRTVTAAAAQEAKQKKIGAVVAEHIQKAARRLRKKPDFLC
jgi:hypothetical protein